ncbi:pyruvate kinase [Croceitalea rosinachiae]|uniref:pyruvate kinase n=1 Tax=Croceitalea rosinachiae TaxID=3075596 RepID=A0ABU3AAA1_9FLAO|nr:pyruvate kinase [Croceitalea sp. F388]MDT0606740.1 pyruvate kinase [Croceitalea sp. F388]
MLNLQIDKLILIIERLLGSMSEKEESYKETLKEVHPSNFKSVTNLIHYRTLRDFDLRGLQEALKTLGLTRLANAESHILFSLLNTKSLLQIIAGKNGNVISKSAVSIAEAENLMIKNNDALFGSCNKRRRVRVMVTQPAQSAHDYKSVYDMVKNGMDCARINCAHDSPEIWEAIISNVKRAAQELHKEVKIAMDLAGPKIRTGQIPPGPPLKKFKPKKDVFGQVWQPIEIALVSRLDEEKWPNGILVNQEWLKQLRVNDIIHFKDTRAKKRKLKVVRRENDAFITNCFKTAYIKSGTVLKPERIGLTSEIVLELPNTEQYVLLKKMIQSL